MIESKAEEKISSESLGIKLDSSKSMFAKRDPKPADFEEKAKDAHSSSEDKKVRAFELSKNFMAIFQSKVLTQNKGPKEKALEKETINNLIAWAVELNNDQAEKEGIGSVGLITLLFNCILKLRDSINSLEHRLSDVEKLLAKALADKDAPK